MNLLEGIARILYPFWPAFLLIGVTVFLVMSHHS